MDCERAADVSVWRCGALSSQYRPDAFNQLDWTDTQEIIYISVYTYINKYNAARIRALNLEAYYVAVCVISVTSDLLHTHTRDIRWTPVLHVGHTAIASTAVHRLFEKCR